MKTLAPIALALAVFAGTVVLLMKRTDDESGRGFAAAETYLRDRTQYKVPGAVLVVADRERIRYHEAFGVLEKGGFDGMPKDAVFDLQSMTKAIGTAPLALALQEEGKLKLDEPVQRLLPEFVGAGKEKVTLRQLLSHSGGVIDEISFAGVKSPAEAWARMLQAPLAYPPGTRVLYSDPGFRIAGRVLEAAAGENLGEAMTKRLWHPLGMSDTTYLPPAAWKARLAGNGRTRGAVADEQDAQLGGMVGCDGVFSSARDVAVFGQMLLGRGERMGKRVLRAESVEEMARNQTPFVDIAATDTDRFAFLLLAPKTLGWELMTPNFSHGGTKLSAGSYGKVGAAGTFVWIDPAKGMVAVYLTSYGVPPTFDAGAWNVMLEAVGPEELFGLVAGEF